MPKEFADVVVLIPGITGSALERNGREVWGTSLDALLRGLFSGGQTIQDLRLEDDDPDVDDLGDGVRATRLVNDVHLFPGLWAIDGYTKVGKRLQQRLGLSAGTNYFELPYDWRRDNRVAARKLQRESAGWLARRRQTHPDAKLVLVAHSMGGLVSRHFLEVLGGWRDTRALITFGTPYRGSINALDSLVNGVRKAGVVDLTELTRSWTSVYQLLPIYPCLDTGNGELVHVTGALDALGLSARHRERAVAADGFHRRIEAAVAEQQATVPAGAVRYSIHAVVGIDQPTSQTAIVRGSKVEVRRTRGTEDESGDGTVPRVSARPIEPFGKQTVFAVARHGSLQNADAVLAHVNGVLTEPRDIDTLRAGDAAVTVSLDIERMFARDEEVRFAVRPSARGIALEAVITSTSGSSPAHTVALAPSDDEWLQQEVPPLPSGAYRITVTGDPTEVEPISDVFAVA